MYNHRVIEPKIQKYWFDHDVFKTKEKGSKKYYVLDMFPYPSGQGLHVGHLEGYTATDIIARFKRYQGFDVLHPIGWDAFGLPAEQFALKTNQLPQTFTPQNIDNFRIQLQQMGFSYDYKKEVDTTDPRFYAQTQWIFGQMYKKGLAQIRDIEVNWCPDLKTVLANEEILTLEDGQKVSERGHFKVVKKPMRQWVLKITKYASRLYDDLKLVNWPSSLVNLQRNWIKNPDGSLHLKDWVFSRQRYWGEPFPIAYDQEDKIKLIEDLPVKLPLLEKIEPSGTGESPLANAKEWLYFDVEGKTWRRETNTMPQWAGSSWYYLAYILKQEDGSYLQLNSPQAKKKLDQWLPVDLYIGGQEHAVLHLLYARFWHKVLYDLKIVSTLEPFHKIVNQGMILGPDNHKMSKSRGNIISPDQIIIDYGADSLRLYEMFSGPLEDTKTWSNVTLKAMHRFCKRIYNTLKSVKIGKSLVESEYHSLIQKSTALIESLKFNLVISQMMVFINHLLEKKQIAKNQVEGFCVLLSLFAPHLAEELLSQFNLKPLHLQSWPQHDLTKIKKSQIILAIQINGKLRDTLILNPNDSKNKIILKAKQSPKVITHLNQKEVIKIIYIKEKVLNFVLKS